MRLLLPPWPAVALAVTILAWGRAMTIWRKRRKMRRTLKSVSSALRRRCAPLGW
jgi:hypothetical protein